MSALPPDACNGWQAVLQIEDEPACNRAMADAAAAALGWTVEEEIDADNGLWMCTIREEDLLAIERDGFVERDLDSVYGAVELP